MDFLDHMRRLERGLTVVRPEGPGPFPVCVQMHGCGGVPRMQHDYAQAGCNAGVAIVILDSFSPRGIGRREAQLTICSGLRLRGAERARDLVATLLWLQDQPWADVERVAAAGWSHGAWAIMEAMVAAPPGDGLISRLRSTILFYPYAGPPSMTHREGWGANRPKVYACLGGRDAVVGTAAPTRALGRLQYDGLQVEILYLSEATHGFDEANSTDPRTRYRADLADQARTFYVDALRESLAVQP